LKSALYEARFGAFAAMFAGRRKEMELALQVHTTLGVDITNRTLADIDHGVRSLDEKLNMISLFRRLASPNEKKLLELIALKGGPEACMADDTILQELITVSMNMSYIPSPGSPDGLATLKQELSDDMKETSESNMIEFLKKLDEQKTDLATELKETTEREGDRVVTAVTAGPHDHITDPASLLQVSIRHVAECLSTLGVKVNMEGNGQSKNPEPAFHIQHGRH
jgi:hypothetical protein